MLCRSNQETYDHSQIKTTGRVHQVPPFAPGS
jgi:hypothetical protein